MYELLKFSTSFRIICSFYFFKLDGAVLLIRMLTANILLLNYFYLLEEKYFISGVFWLNVSCFLCIRKLINKP